MPTTGLSEREVDSNTEQLPMQSVPITTKVELKPRSWRGLLDASLCDKVCQ
jgi:hypothetical protein